MEINDELSGCGLLHETHKEICRKFKLDEDFKESVIELKETLKEILKILQRSNSGGS